MKTAVLTGIRQMAIIDQPVPRLQQSGDVLLRMECVGVCGSDVHYYTTGRIGSQVVQYPFAVGHEGAATVEAVSPGVSRVKPGDRVAIEPAVSCFACDQCRRSRPHTCRKLKFLGCPGQIPGCLSEFIVMPEVCCFPIPKSMTFEQAALCEPLSIGVYAVQQSVPLAGARIGILGLGPIGLSVLLAAQAAGPAAIYATDRREYRCRLGAAHGAAWAGNPDSTDVVREVLAREPEQLDVVFECCGQQEACDQAFELLRPGGKLMLIGIPEFDRWSFSADSGRRREICIQNVRRQNHCVQKTLDDVGEDRFVPDFMITHRFALGDCQRAFDLVDQYADGVVKAMISFR